MAHISLVTLGVRDVADATAFYEKLGWRRSSASVEGVVSFLAGGTVVLALFGRDDLAEDAGEPVPASYGVNVDYEQAVDEVMEQAAAAGARIIVPARRTDWGGYAGYFTDADGHAWEIAHNPGFPLGDEGQVFLPGFEEQLREEMEANDTRLTEFITGADGDDGRTVARLADGVLDALRGARESISAMLDDEANNVVLATMLSLSQRSRGIPTTDADYWLTSAASTIVSGMIRPGEG
jgi:predicted lactoylglutathione lyase